MIENIAGIIVLCGLGVLTVFLVLAVMIYMSIEE
jgi:hypothetical protein